MVPQDRVAKRQGCAVVHQSRTQADSPERRGSYFASTALVLKAQRKPEDARNACSQALRVDPNYLPADLCLADLCATEQRWEEMLHFANTAVALDPANDPHAYFYAAGASFGLHRLPEAEKSALKSATDPQDVTMVKKYLADLAASHRK